MLGRLWLVVGLVITLTVVAACTAPKPAAKQEAVVEEVEAMPEPAVEPAPVVEPDSVVEPTPEPIPAPSGPPPPPIDAPLVRLSVPGEFPGKCRVTMQTAAAVDVGPLADILANAFGGRGSSYEDFCESLVPCRGCRCDPDGPWFVSQDDLEVALVVPLRNGNFGRIPELGLFMDGTEESALVEDASVYGSDPVDAYLMMALAEQDCFDEGDEELCGLNSTSEEHTVVTGLANGQYLLTRVEIDVSGPYGQEHGYDEPEVEVRREVFALRACGRRATVEIPEQLRAAFAAAGTLDDERDEHELEAVPASQPDGPTEPQPPYASEAEARAAGKRCGEGWKRLQVGEYDAAKREIEGALAVLEHANDERGRKSLGACLYNRGRLAEQLDERDAARGYYRRSLAVRPNDTVAARLAKLH